MQTLSAEDVALATPYSALVDALEKVFISPPVAPPRQHYDVDAASPGDVTLLMMPAWAAGDYIGTKMVTVAHANSERGLPTVCGIYILMNAETGQPVAIMDAEELTARRTAAASALAAKYLAREDAKTLLVVGTGKLAPYVANAHSSVRNYETIMIWGRSHEKAERVVAELKASDMNAVVVDGLQSAAMDADVISCATTSSEPLIMGEWLKDGAHLDLIGAFRPDMRECDDACVKKASLFVDTYAGALKEGGDLVQPLEAGLISRTDIAADLTALTKGDHLGRESEREITLFKSVGTSLEDYAAAKLVYESKRS